MSERKIDSSSRYSQHADVPIWCDDPCCCEPEPRWQAVAEEIASQDLKDQSDDLPADPRDSHTPDRPPR